MKTTIDSAGRLVIPQSIRKEAGLEPGIDLEVRFVNGHIEIEPSALPTRTEKRGRFVVAVPLRPTSTLRAEIVEKTRQAVHQERSADRPSTRRRKP